MEQQPRDESRAATVREGGAESWAEAGEYIDHDTQLPTAVGSKTPSDLPGSTTPDDSGLGGAARTAGNPRATTTNVRRTTADVDPSPLQRGAADRRDDPHRDEPRPYSPHGDDYSSSSAPAGEGSNTPVGDEPYNYQHWDEGQPQPPFLGEDGGWAGTGSMMRQAQDMMPSLATVGGLAALATAGGLAYTWWSNRRRKSRYEKMRDAVMDALVEMGETSAPYVAPYVAQFSSRVPGAVGRAAANSRSAWIPFALLPLALWLRQRGKQGERASKQMLEPLDLDDRTEDLAKRSADWIEKYGRRFIRDNAPFEEDEGWGWTPWLVGAAALGGGYYAYRNGWIGSMSGGSDTLSSMTSSVTSSLGSFGSSTGSSQSGSTMVRDVMTRGAEVVSPSMPIAEVARKMRDLDVGSLPVCDGTRLLGMVTDRDLSVRALAEGKDPSKTTARDVMSPDVVWVFEDEPAAMAASVMRQRQIRRLPVLDRNERLIGIVALGDLATDLHDDRLKGNTLEAISEPSTPTHTR